jgi:cell division protein FtsN
LSPAAARDPAAILSGAATGAPAPKAAASAPAGSDPFVYFVQAGAYGKTEDAEQQRARLAMMGLEAKLTEREQSGRTVFRVRLGPFDKKDDADAAKAKLGDAGIESALVRVQR